MDLGGVVLPLQGEKSGMFTEDEVTGQEKRMTKFVCCYDMGRDRMNWARKWHSTTRLRF